MHTLYPSVVDSVLNLCSYCEENQVLEKINVEGEDDFICDDCCCDYFTYCNICGNYQNTDFQPPCRHLSWEDDCCDWIGCGSYTEAEYHKQSFFQLLNKVGIDASKSLLRSMQKHKYHNMFGGTIFGWSYLDAYWLKKDGNTYNYGDLIMDNIYEKEEQLKVGIAWLMSLWSDYYQTNSLPVTKKADKITAKWIKEWIAIKQIFFLLFLKSSSEEKRIYFKMVN